MDCRSRRNTLTWLRMRMQGGFRFTCLAVSPRPLSPSSGSLAGRCREVEKGQGRRQRGEEDRGRKKRVSGADGWEDVWERKGVGGGISFLIGLASKKKSRHMQGNGAKQFVDREICELLMPPLIRVPPPASESSSCGQEAGANKPRWKNFHDAVGETSCVEVRSGAQQGRIKFSRARWTRGNHRSRRLRRRG